MLILKIKSKGMFINIPGLKPVRSPADIDVTKVNLSIVLAYLHNAGVRDYELVSSSEQNKLALPIQSKVESITKNDENINKRFEKIEKIISKLAEKKEIESESNQEQITNKLELIETLAKKILERDPEVVISKSPYKKNETKSKEPVVEEIDTFIPEINVSDLKLKSGSKQTIKQDSVDLDDSADLLSRIMGQED